MTFRKTARDPFKLLAGNGRLIDWARSFSNPLTDEKVSQSPGGNPDAARHNGGVAGTGHHSQSRKHRHRVPYVRLSDWKVDAIRASISKAAVGKAAARRILDGLKLCWDQRQ